MLKIVPSAVPTSANISSSYGLSSGTATDSICPKGWRLPGYEGDGSFYELLKHYSNRNSSTGSLVHGLSILQFAPLYIFPSGWYSFDSGANILRTTHGYYWSRNSNSTIFSYDLYFDLTNFYPLNGASRGFGHVLRCLARSRFKRGCNLRIYPCKMAKVSYGLSSGTATDSICPKGWRLPGNEGDGSYLELFKHYSNRGGNVGDWTIDKHYDTGLIISPLAFLRPGHYHYIAGLVDDRTSRGSYWSSRSSSILALASTLLHAQGVDALGVGFALRCLAREKKKAPILRYNAAWRAFVDTSILLFSENFNRLARFLDQD